MPIPRFIIRQHRASHSGAITVTLYRHHEAGRIPVYGHGSMLEPLHAKLVADGLAAGIRACCGTEDYEWIDEINEPANGGPTR